MPVWKEAGEVYEEDAELVPKSVLGSNPWGVPVDIVFAAAAAVANGAVAAIDAAASLWLTLPEYKPNALLVALDGLKWCFALPVLCA